MSTPDDPGQDMPLDTFVSELAKCGFQWVKRIGHVNVHIFEHDVTHEVMPIPLNATWCVPAMSTMPAKRAANPHAVRDRVFDPAVIQQATVLAARYPVAVRSRQGGYVGTVEGFPSVLGHGKSKHAAVSATR